MVLYKCHKCNKEFNQKKLCNINNLIMKKFNFFFEKLIF